MKYKANMNVTELANRLNANRFLDCGKPIGLFAS